MLEECRQQLVSSTTSRVNPADQLRSPDLQPTAPCRLPHARQSLSSRSATHATDTVGVGLAVAAAHVAEIEVHVPRLRGVNSIG